MKVQEIKELKLDTDIIVNIKPQYGSIGFIRCVTMGINNEINDIFEVDLSTIKGNQKFNIPVGMFDLTTDKDFIAFHIQLSPLPGKSKKEVHIILNQDGKKIKKATVVKSIDSVIYRIV